MSTPKSPHARPRTSQVAKSRTDRPNRYNDSLVMRMRCSLIAGAGGVRAGSAMWPRASPDQADLRRKFLDSGLSFREASNGPAIHDGRAERRGGRRPNDDSSRGRRDVAGEGDLQIDDTTSARHRD